jgi:hypothetical protein
LGSEGLDEVPIRLPRVYWAVEDVVMVVEDAVSGRDEVAESGGVSAVAAVVGGNLANDPG